MGETGCGSAGGARSVRSLRERSAKCPPSGERSADERGGRVAEEVDASFLSLRDCTAAAPFALLAEPVALAAPDGGERGERVEPGRASGDPAAALDASRAGTAPSGERARDWRRIRICWTSPASAPLASMRQSARLPEDLFYANAGVGSLRVAGEKTIRFC
jgi:hypothetical protein